MTRATQLQTIVEEIYGKLAIVYHRTKKEAVQSFNKGSMFRVGSGDMYGRGVYTTYDLKSQLKEHMSLEYGDYIVKSKVNLDKFLIFDIDIARRVYPRFPTINDQFKYVFRSNLSIENIINLKNDVFTSQFLRDSGKFTSGLAQLVVENQLGWLMRNTRGIVFTGVKDGKVVVVYDPKSIIPMSVALAPRTISSIRQLNFTPIEKMNRSLLNPSLRPDHRGIEVIRRYARRLKSELDRSSFTKFEGFIFVDDIETQEQPSRGEDPPKELSITIKYYSINAFSPGLHMEFTHDAIKHVFGDNFIIVDSHINKLKHGYVLKDPRMKFDLRPKNKAMEILLASIKGIHIPL